MYFNPIVKEHLIDIINDAYCDEPDYLKERFGMVKLTFEDKEPKSKLGHYERDNWKIVIVHINKEPVSLAIVLIHELAHHINRVLNENDKSHDDLFFGENYKLLRSALALGKISADEALARGDRDKYGDWEDAVIMECMGCEPNIPISDKGSSLSVPNAYHAKDALQSAGYVWDAFSSTWKKYGLFGDDIEKEKNFVKSIGLDPANTFVTNENMFHLESALRRKENKCIGLKVIVDGNTFDIKDKLKGLKFSWNKYVRIWEKLISSEKEGQELVEIINKMSDDAKASIVTYDFKAK